MSIDRIRNWWSSTSSSNLLMYVVIGLLFYSLMGSMQNTNEAQRLVEHNVRMVNESYELALETSDSRVNNNTEVLKYKEFLDDEEDRKFLDTPIPDKYTDGL